jgi:hypothetical protein
MIIIEFMKNDIGDYIKVQEEDLYETINTLTTQFIAGEVSYFHVFRS